MCGMGDYNDTTVGDNWITEMGIVIDDYIASPAEKHSPFVTPKKSRS